MVLGWSVLLAPPLSSPEEMNPLNDFYLSAFLVASNIPLSSHERWNGRTTFKFAETDELSQLIDEYFADHVKVSPIRYGPRRA